MLTPMDIDQKKFKKAIRGYHVGEVEDFLLEINESYEQLYLENQAAKEQIALLSDAVAQYKSMEETLKTALAVAKRDGEDVKSAAREEAETMLRESRVQAEEEMSRLSYQYEQMKHSVEIFRAKVVSLLHAQLEVIKEYGEADAVPIPKFQSDSQKEPMAEMPLEEQNTMELPTIREEEQGDTATKEE